MAFVGRVEEQGDAERVLASGSAGILVGANGIGKSALIEEIGRRRGTAVLHFAPAERMWPFSGLSAVAAHLGGERGDAIDRILMSSSGSGDQAVAVEVHRALHRIGGDPCDLLIDGLDEVDTSSARVLAYLLARIHGTGIAVLATAVRVAENSPFAGLPQIPVGVLNVPDALALAAETLGPDAAPGITSIVARFTGGHPWAIRRTSLTVHELAGTAPMPLPLRVVITAQERRRLDMALRYLEPDAIGLLDVLALAPLTARSVLLEVAGDLPHVVDDLIDRGIVESRHDMLRIADPALRLALHAKADARQRRRLHALAARAYHGVDRAFERWHHSFGEVVEDDEEALLSIAADFVRAGDVATAVEFAERGLRNRTGTAARGGLLIRLGDALWAFGHFALAELYMRRVGAFDRDGVRLAYAILSLRVADSAHRTVDDAVVDAYLDDHLESDPAGCARLLAEAARIRLRRGEDDRARARVAAAIALHPDVIPLEYELLQDAADVGRGFAGRTRSGDRLAEAARPGALAGLGVAELLPLLSYLTYTEQYAVCRRIASVFLERIRRPEPSWMEQVQFRLAVNDLRAEDASASRESFARWQRSVSPEYTADAVATLMLAGVESLAPHGGDGTLDDLIRRGRELCDREHNTALPAFFDALEGRAALAAGRFEDAVVVLDAAVGANGGEVDPALLRAEGDLIEALWRSGRRAEAAERSRLFATYATMQSSSWLTRAAERSRARCAPGDPRPAAVQPASDLPAPAAMPSLDSLTPQEREVARRVYLGMRNREIAEELFVSLRTVELRLTRIYRKLGIRSRAHLVALLGPNVSRLGDAPTSLTA